MSGRRGIGSWRHTTSITETRRLVWTSSILPILVAMTACSVDPILPILHSELTQAKFQMGLRCTYPTVRSYHDQALNLLDLSDCASTLLRSATRLAGGPP